MKIAVKMGLNSIKFRCRGKSTIKFKNTNNTVCYKRPNAYINGLLSGTRVMCWSDFSLFWSVDS